jgi:hypothetical protein
MRRTSPPADTSSAKAKLSRVNPYPRVLMICGAVLVAYGVIAPAGILLRNMVQGLRTTSATSVAKVAPVTKATPSDSMLKSRESAASTKIASTKVVVSPAEQKNRDDIMKLYAEWKDAWKRHDIEAVMRLYSPRVQFRSVGGPFVDYNGARKTLLFIWGRDSYIVSDIEPPELSLNGEHATLLVEQLYTKRGYRGGLKFDHDFVLERENTGKRNARQWRIVKSEFVRGRSVIY